MKLRNNKINKDKEIVFLYFRVWFSRKKRSVCENIENDACIDKFEKH